MEEEKTKPRRDGKRQNGRTSEVVGVVEEVAVVLFGHDGVGRSKRTGSSIVFRGDSNFERRRAATGKGGGRAAGSAALPTDVRFEEP
jgi:hypothetical protein